MPSARLRGLLSTLSSQPAAASACSYCVAQPAAADPVSAELLWSLTDAEADDFCLRLCAAGAEPRTHDQQLVSAIGLLSETAAESLLVQLQAEDASLIPSAADWPLEQASFAHAVRCSSCRLGRCVAKLAREESQWLHGAQQKVLGADAREAAGAALAAAVPSWGAQSAYCFKV